MGRRRSRSEDYDDDDPRSRRLYGDDNDKGGRRAHSVDTPRNRGGGGGYASESDDEGVRSTRSTRSYKKKKKRKFKLFGSSSRRTSDEDGDTMLSRDTNGTGNFGGPADPSERLAPKMASNPNRKIKVMPDAAYPDTFLNRSQRQDEMNKKSVFFHDLRSKVIPAKKSGEIGQLRLEILQCFGLPAPTMTREPQAYCVAVLGQYAFKTDVMPAVTSPMWLAKMRRACVFPIRVAYSKLYIGVFDDGVSETSQYAGQDYIGRIVIDISRLRPTSTYDFTLPLRQSAHVFTRAQQGAIRVRLTLDWKSERAAIMSYVPSKFKFRKQPDTKLTINCVDEKSFRNVAHAVHGSHMPGKFSMTLLKSTVREVNFTRIHVFRYVWRRERYNLRNWVYPLISGFVFAAWMHAVIFNTIRFIPGHILTFILLHLYKNYAYYGMDSVIQNGFLAPTFEELAYTLLWGTRRRKFLKPLHLEVDEQHVMDPMEHIESYGERRNEVILEIAEKMRLNLKTTTTNQRLRTYKNCFLGRDAVDFLVSNGFAYTRGEAVALGRRLEKELKLFRHLSNSYDFDDEDHYYQFIDDTKKFVVKSHRPQGKTIFSTIGFMKDSEGLIESQGHVEFPYANGKEVPRFSIKQSLVVKTAATKKYLKDQEQALESIDVAEFGVLEYAHEKKPEEEVPEENNIVRATVRRGSIMAQAASQAVVNMPGTLMNAPGSIAKTVINAPGNITQAAGAVGTAVVGGAVGAVGMVGDAAMGTLGAVGVAKRQSMEFGDTHEIYGKLEERQNPTLDELIEEQKKANTYDPYMDNSDDDVDDVKKSKQGKQFILEEKKLKPPPNQDFSEQARSQDKTLAKSLALARRKVHGMTFHLFHDQVYKVDPNKFPTYMVKEEPEAVTTKKSRFGKKKRKASMDHNEALRKKSKMTPYDSRHDELDKVLQINKYSHTNPWINRIAIIIQPLVESVQVGLFFFRGIFNVMTWQDPILSFWVAFLGPLLVLALHIAPYRLIFFFSGIYFVGPQNWVLRIMQEKRADYEPPDFDKLVKKKKIEKEENYEEIQFFSSQAPGNQQVKYKDVDPNEVRQIIVPNHRLKATTRFYDWPPEPEYAKVYSASAAARNALEEVDDLSDSKSIHEEDYYFDPALAKKKKKKKKGLKKVASQAKKGAGAVVSGTLDVGGAVLERTAHSTVGVVKGATKVTKSAVKGTGNAVKGTAATLSRNRAKGNNNYDDDSSY